MTQRSTSTGAGRGGAPAETIRGTVGATNDRGIKIGDRWLDYSRFRDVPRAQVGQEVEVEVVRDRFINALTVLSDGPGPGEDLVLDLGEPNDLGESGYSLDAAPPATGASVRTRPPSRGGYVTDWGADRNTEIRRLALIKAAADFHAGRTKSSDADVLDSAIRWEAWVVDRGTGSGPGSAGGGTGGAEPAE